MTNKRGMTEKFIAGNKTRRDFLGGDKGVRRIFTIFILAFNFLIFIQVNRAPVLWQDSEVSYYNFLWSKQAGPEQEPTLRSGLHRADLLKLFSSEDLGREFRARHFAWLIEMLSFKLGQSLSFVSFSNYFLVVLHLLNVCLVFFLLRGLTANAEVGLVGALLVLNSGVAVSSLYFPFINAKELLMTLFLTSWLVILGAKGNFLGCSARRWVLSGLLAVLALSTDELTPFLFLVLLVYIFLTEKVNVTKLWRLAAGTALTLGAFVGLTWLFFVIDARLGEGVVTAPYQRYVSALINYYQQGGVFHDTFIAFTQYFLRRNFGFWDFSTPGLAAAIACLLLVYWLIRSASKKREALLSGAIVLFIIFKALLFPHNRGLHDFIMPPGTRFPCTLFFSFYYPYVDMILLAIVLAWRLGAGIGTQRRFFGVLTVVTIISTSNYLHARESVNDVLAHHGYYQTHQKVIPAILAVQDPLRFAESVGPVYLSFPSGSKSFYSRKLVVENIWAEDPAAYEQELLPEFINYGNLLPVIYLRDLEQGRLIMSLKNAPLVDNGIPPADLASARLFYDVPEKRLLDLNALRKRYGPEAFEPIIARGAVTRPLGDKGSFSNQKILCFVKGAARLAVVTAEGETLITSQQRYGYSYQLFLFSPTEWKKSFSGKLYLMITPFPSDHEITVLGPFFIN